MWRGKLAGAHGRGRRAALVRRQLGAAGEAVRQYTRGGEAAGSSPASNRRRPADGPSQARRAGAGLRPQEVLYSVRRGAACSRQPKQLSMPRAGRASPAPRPPSPRATAASCGVPARTRRRPLCTACAFPSWCARRTMSPTTLADTPIISSMRILNANWGSAATRSCHPFHIQPLVCCSGCSSSPPPPPPPLPPPLLPPPMPEPPPPPPACGTCWARCHLRGGVDAGRRRQLRQLCRSTRCRNARRWQAHGRQGGGHAPISVRRSPHRRSHLDGMYPLLLLLPSSRCRANGPARGEAAARHPLAPGWRRWKGPPMHTIGRCEHIEVMSRVGAIGRGAAPQASAAQASC